MISNKEIAKKLQVSESMASRLCSGERMPSTETFALIVSEFDLDGNEALAEYRKGSANFGPWLTKKADEWAVRRSLPRPTPDDGDP